MKTIYDIYEGLLDDMEDVLANTVADYEKSKMIVVTSRKELVDAIKDHFNRGVYDLNSIDTHEITDMCDLFNMTYFGPLKNYHNVMNKIDISKWDVSNVNDMGGMFTKSQFNGDISKWDVSNVKIMNHMFSYSKFNGDISKWDVSNVKTMNHMFLDSPFNGDISKWDVSKVENMRSNMFFHCPLEKNPPKWYKN